MSSDSFRPLTQLQKMTTLWGWSAPLRFCQHHFDDGHPNIVTWYETGKAEGCDDDCFLQINECPQGQAEIYSGAVFAIRYEIYTGWQKFRLFSEVIDLQGEVNRLKKWLDYDWFSTSEKREQFRLMYPKCTGYTWDRLRKEARD